MNAKQNVPQTAGRHPDEHACSILHDVCSMLPSICSPRPVRRSFPRVLDNAIRAAISFVIAAIIATRSWSLQLFSVPYLFAVISLVTVRPTVGSTIQNIDQQGKGALAAAVVDVVIISTGIANLPSTHRIIAVELLLFATCTGLAFYFHPPLARRFSLALHALVMISVADGVGVVYLPMQIFFTFAVAYGVSLLLVLLPFPRLARDELQDRYQLALLCLSRVFDEGVSAYISTEPLRPQLLMQRMQSYLDTVAASLTVMRRLQTEASWECDLFLLTSPLSISLAPPVVVDVDRIEQLYWISTNLLHTLSAFHFSAYHAAFVHFLRDALLAFTAAQSEYLQLLSSDQGGEVTQERVDGCRKRLDAAMEEGWHSYTVARRTVYGMRSRDDQDVTLEAEGHRRAQSNSAESALCSPLRAESCSSASDRERPAHGARQRGGGPRHSLAVSLCAHPRPVLVHDGHLPSQLHVLSHDALPSRADAAAAGRRRPRAAASQPAAADARRHHHPAQAALPAGQAEGAAALPLFLVRPGLASRA